VLLTLLPWIAVLLLATVAPSAMVDARVAARDGRVLDAGTSDHRPVVVTIEPRKTP
jgi:hypothetical protein